MTELAENTSAAPASALPEWMQRIEDTLKPFQKTVRQFLLTRPAAAVWASVGSGKTLITLSALSYIRPAGHILVIAPRNIAVDVWPQEVIDWDIPLRIVSLNITPPGMLDKRGKPLKGQRELKPEEFRTLIDSAPAEPSSLYTVGIDRLPDLVHRIARSGPPRTRPVGAPHPSGEFDLDSARDALVEVTKKFTAHIKADPALDQSLPGALRAAMVTDLKPRTASGLAPSVVISHADADTARDLRQESVREILARLYTEVTGQDLRVAVQIAHPDYSHWPFATVVLDESQGFKNPSSSRWSALNAVRPYIRHMIQLSGTPAPEGAHELWAQITLLDQGACLGTDYQEHLRQWFTPDQIIDGQVTKWKISPSAEKALHNQVSHLAVSAENSELKLPGFTPPVIHRLQMDPELMTAYRDFGKDAVMAIAEVELETLRERAYQQRLALTADQAAVAAAGKKALAEGHRAGLRKAQLEEAVQAARTKACHDTGDHTAAQADADAVTLSPSDMTMIEAANAGVLRNKLMQFAAGAIYLPEEDDKSASGKRGTRAVAELHDLKVRKLVEICDEHFAAGTPGAILVAYRFEFEKQRYLQALHEAGHTGARAYNGMPDTKRAWSRGEIPVMLIHPASAGHGLNLQHGGHTLIWTTLPDSNEHFQQTPGRLNRPGQPYPVIVHQLLVQNTIDTRMPAALEGKQAGQQRLLEATRAEISGVLREP